MNEDGPKTVDKSKIEKSKKKSARRKNNCSKERYSPLSRESKDVTEEGDAPSTIKESGGAARKGSGMSRVRRRIETLRKKSNKSLVKNQDMTAEEQTMEEIGVSKEKDVAKEKDMTKEKDVAKEKEVTKEKDAPNEKDASKDTNKESSKPYAKLMEAEQKALTRLEWYHGLMPREEIEDLLKNGREGDFCLRKTDVSKKERYAVSVYWGNRVRHILPKLNKDNKWCFGGREPSYDKIEKLLASKSELQTDGTKLLNTVPRPDWYILHEHITMKKKLGSGNFGDVFLAELYVKNADKIPAAVKTLRGKLGKQERVQFVKEASLVRKFNHDNIVRILGVAPQQEPMMIILELASGGCLKNHCRDKVELTVADLTRYCLDAAQGMEYLSVHLVIHRDIAARNCLLTDKYVVKISDFGLSCADRTEVKEQKLKNVPVKWLAPETLNRGVFTTKSDVWSFGIMMWEVFSRCKTDPYPGMSNKDVRALVVTEGRMDPPEETPKPCSELMKKCWLLKPEERPGWSDIVRLLSEHCGVAPQKVEKIPVFVEEQYCGFI
uniref:Tyrosine-protein kinase n=1 Tax=Steinernema glaseri TaxID=37863 RepID=A0A1I8A532_9BILA